MRKLQAQHKLGVLFFFSCTQHVDNFFTTITYQLTMRINEYIKILNLKIQHNPTLPSKGLDAQFCKLIIELFLELMGRNVGVQDKTVIINGLNECNGNTAQLKIMKLVAKSVIDHGDKISLLQAFFSQPELHTDQEFSSYSRSYFLSKVKLSMSKSNNGDIMYYFHDKLYPLSSPNTMWPLEDTFNILVAIAAGLWVYAATIVRFIIDQGLPLQQLDYIFEFYSQQMQLDTKSTVTAKLDAFYGVIISHISSKHHSITQQSLLIHHITSEVILHMHAMFRALPQRT